MWRARSVDKDGVCIEDSVGSMCDLGKGEVASSGIAPRVFKVGCKEFLHLVLVEEGLLEALRVLGV